jgi:peptidoglycan/LPS O-acetylase OafA/YrhL
LPYSLFASLAAAVVSYYLVEVPLRRRIRAWFAQPASYQLEHRKTVIVQPIPETKEA